MLRVELAKLEDAEAITAIKIRAFNKEINTYLGRDGGPPEYDQVQSEKDIINQFIAYKILLGDIIIGGLFLIPLDKSKMCFEDFVIDPVYQNRGYGYHVMTLIESMHANIKEWQLSTPIFSVSNQHLYEKFGYREVSRNNDEIEYVKLIGKTAAERNNYK